MVMRQAVGELLADKIKRSELRRLNTYPPRALGNENRHSEVVASDILERENGS